MPPESWCGYAVANSDQADHLQRLLHTAPHVSAGQTSGHEEREADVLEDRLPGRELVEFLEHDDAIRTGPADGGTVEPDLTLTGQHEAGGGLQQRALAAARRAKEHEALALMEVQAHTVCRAHDPPALGILECDVPQREQWFGHRGGQDPATLCGSSKR